MAPLDEDIDAAFSTDWKQFTPAEINSKKCMARIWGNGAGVQCRHAPEKGSEFCSSHNKNDAWQTHGRVDGPIPNKKLQEFLKANKRDPKVSQAKSSESKTTPTKKRAATIDLLSPPDAVKLKKPTGGAFGVYRSQSMETIKASLLSKREESTLPNIAKEAALLWKELPVEKKSEFEDAYNEKKRAYKAAHGRTRKVKKTVVVKHDGTPMKRPLNSYGLFVKERRESIKASLPSNHKITDVAKEAGVLWKALTDDERNAFRERTDTEWSTYKESALAARKAEAAKAKNAQTGMNALFPQRAKIHRRRRKRAW